MKRHTKNLFQKIVFVALWCSLFNVPFALPHPETPAGDNQTPAAREQLADSLNETELKKIVTDFYDEAQRQHVETQLPEEFLLCYALIQDNVVPVTKEDLFIALRSVTTWLADQLNLPKKKSARTEKQPEPDIRAPRPDAPSQESSTMPVGPGNCCDNSELLRLLGIIRSRIGSVDECSCEETILSIFGDACAILGPCETISSGIKDALDCCETTYTTVVADFNFTWSILATLTTPTIVVNVDLSPVFTVLNSIQTCCSNLTATVIRDFNETWTILAALTTPTVVVNCDLGGVFTALVPIQKCCSDLTATVLREFNETWTILKHMDADLHATLTSIAAVQTCCSNLTATLLREFNETWTILAALTTPTVVVNCDISGVFTALVPIQKCCSDLTATVLREFNETWTILSSIQTCCSNLTATVLREFNETWTMIASVQLCCSNLTATVLREFNETWTILAALTTPTVVVNCDVNGIYTTLGNVGDILGKDATIAGTLKDIKICCSNLTATVLREFNETWTILAHMDADLHGSFTMLNAIQTCCSNLTATVIRDFNETWTILAALTSCDLGGIYTTLGNVGDILGDDATISGTLKDIKICCSNLTATVLREFNETWTILSSIQTCCSNLTATVIRDFNETWTILAALDLGGVYTTLNVLTTDECSPILIRQVDVATTTYTISQPGRYIFAANIVFNPTSPNQRAIEITSSNVTLDLLCHTLSQGNTTTGVDGIRVASGLSGVTIIHGTVQNFTRAGITVSSACSRIYVDSMATFSCNVRGMEFLGTSGAGNQITESEISNCKLVSCCLGASGDIVLTLSQCTDVRVTNCRINQNGTTGHTLQTVRLDNALKCEFNTVETNDNFASTDFRGYELSQATYCVFKHCITKNNQATAAASNNRGFMLESGTSCTANEFFDCSALNLTGTAAVDGFLTDTGCNDNLFMRCQASFNSSHGVATTAIVHGFNVISNSRNSYIDCIARNNSAPNSTATPAPAFGAKGFDLNTCTGCQLLRCLATDQSTGAGSTSVGIQVDQGSQCNIRDCQSSRHGTGFRLDPNNSTSHVFSRNFAGKNTTQYSQFPGGSTDNAATIANINGQLVNPWSNVSVG